MNTTEKKYAINRIRNEVTRLREEKRKEFGITTSARHYNVNVTGEEIAGFIKSGVIAIKSKTEIIDMFKKDYDKGFYNLTSTLIGLDAVKREKQAKENKLWDKFDIYYGKLCVKASEIEDTIMLGADASDTLTLIKDLSKVK